jgi:sulfate adenylyltransferase
MANASSRAATSLIRPHGSDTLLPRLVPTDRREAELRHAATLPQLRLSSREVGDLVMLGIGGFTPLDGFMGYADWQGVCSEMKLANGLFWPIPITLSADPEQAQSWLPGQEIALVDPHDESILGVLTLTESYRPDLAFEAASVFRTTDPAHPGVAQLRDQGAVNLAGPVRVFSDGGFAARFPGLIQTPEETRALFAAKGWRTIAAFQTRNPMHRSHEYLVRIAAEVSDGVLVHSLLGALKPGDIPSEVRVPAIDSLISNYFAPGTVAQGGYPLDMRYAGPREALLHALFRQNYGCTHLIVGRDHAGVGDYYGPFDAQRIFDELPADAMLIKPLKMDWTFWCHACGGMASRKTCPHGDEHRLLISGTKVRHTLATGGTLPAEFSRPEVVEILRRYYESLEDAAASAPKLAGASALNSLKEVA